MSYLADRRRRLEKHVAPRLVVYLEYEGRRGWYVDNVETLEDERRFAIWLARERHLLSEAASWLEEQLARINEDERRRAA
jgi:hypothetical protein